MEYKRRMATYPTGDEEQSIEPELSEGEKKIVLVTHDECTFYANDGKTSRWVEKGEASIFPKGPGGSIMVNEFVCP